MMQMPTEEQPKTDRKFWQKIDDSKKDSFLMILEKNCSEIDLENEPDHILQSLTDATKAIIVGRKNHENLFSVKLSKTFCIKNG